MLEGVPPTALVAIGGNALVREDDPSIAAQRELAARTCAHIGQLVADGWRVVITHGNGPQVGAALLRSDCAAAEAYTMPLDICVASTQGEMGLVIQEAMEAALSEQGLATRVVPVLTRVVVSAADPGFAKPTKPIGPFYTRAQADAKRAAGWTLVEQPPRGWRRVVPSPEPLAVPEEAAVRALLNKGAVVITLGGGGIPVTRQGRLLLSVEAVVDKDLSSALLATRLQADLLLILTDVDGIYLDFRRPAARRLKTVGVEELRRHKAAGHFAPGSMEPKVEAVLRFIDAGGQRAVVALPERQQQALAGLEGTRALGKSRWNASAR